MKNIICTTDFSDSSNLAVHFGIVLAGEFEAKLHLCHVIGLTSTTIYGEAVLDLEVERIRIKNYVQEQLNQLIGDRKVNWEPLIQVGHVSNEITRMAMEMHADLVISSTHGRSGLGRLILGSVTERLMRTLPCPLLVVRSPEQEIAAPPKKGALFKRILVGCDFSPDSNLALQYGVSLAQECQSELHLVHVIEPSIYKNLMKPGTKPGEEIQQDLWELLNKKLTDMVPKEAHNWCAPKTIFLAGQPYEELTKYAVLNNIDLIVLGVRGQTVVETLFVGSTTDRVVRQAQCPVLSIRPTDLPAE
ncbi:MAG: universal stress protein [Pseudomonadota bacterium]